ncbi:hypothetical protein D3C87_1055620 [compost metagenome]
MRLASVSGEPGCACQPVLSSSPLTSGELITSTSAALSLVTAAGFMLAGAASAVQISRSAPRTSASRIVGSSLTSGLRSGEVTPMALSLPDFTCGIARPGGSSASWISPARMPAITCGLPV